MANVEIKSYNQILGAMVRKIIADTAINDVNTGSALLTLLEAAASNDFENNVAILNVLELMNIDAVRNNDLDSYGSNYGLTRNVAARASGQIKITDTNITKRSTRLYSIKPAPIRGATTLYVANASEWNLTGNLYIGRGTQNFEGPIPYTSITDNGSFYTITLGASLQKDHLLTDSVIDGQGTADRQIPANTLVRIPANNVSPDISYVTLRNAVIPAGETFVDSVPVVAVNAGTSGNAGINTITRFSTPPFLGAAVTNTIAFTNGRDAESDESFRDRIKAYSNSLSRGTRQAILSAIYGVSEETDGKQVESANITEPASIADPSIIYIDDGQGFQPSYKGQSVDLLLASANGSEEFLQLANYPLPRAQVVNLAEAPYLLADSMTLKVEVDGLEESIVLYDSDFSNISSVSIYDLATTINTKSVSFKCRLTENSSRLLLYPTDHTAETIKVTGDGGRFDANSSLKFPLNEFSNIKLYKNNKLLREKELSASVATVEFSTWGISTGGNLIISVDDTPPQDRSFTLLDFGASSFFSVTLQDWVRVFNYKFAGLTATATAAGRLVVTSNKGGEESSIKIVGGSYLENMFSSQTLESSGQNSDFILNRQNGNLQIKVDIEAGDTITAGSSDSKGFIVSSAASNGIFNLSNDSSNRPAEMVIVADAARVVPRSLSLPIASTITLLDQGNSIMRIMSSAISSFSNVQAGDYIYIVSRGETRANPLIDPPGSGSWVDDASSGLFKVHAKGEHLYAGVDSYLDVKNVNMVSGGSYAILDALDIQAFYSDKYPQIWRASSLSAPVSASINEVVASINSLIKGVEAKTFRTSYIKITSATETNGSIAIPVSVGAASRVFNTAQGTQLGTESHIANVIPSKSYLTMFKRSEPESDNVWLDRHVYSEIRGSLTANSQPSIDGSGFYSETLTDTATDFLNDISYDDFIEITSGQNKGQSRNIRSILSSSQIGTRNSTPRTLMDYTAGDEYSAVKGLELSSEDNIVMILDNDPIAKTIDMPLSRTGQINSGSQLSNFIPTSIAFSADDIDNESGIDFGKADIWGTLPSQGSTNFNDYNIWFRARNWYYDNGAAMIIRASDYGPIGEQYTFGIDYPSTADSESTLVQSTIPGVTSFRYVFGSNSAINTDISPGDQFTLTDLGSSILRLKFPTTASVNSVNIGDVISIGETSGFSTANCGTFSILQKDDIAKTLDFYSIDGVATAVGSASVQEIVCVADSSGSLNGSYFIVSAANGDTVKFWYDNNNSGTLEPASIATTRSWEIDILNDDTDIDVATKTAIIMAGDPAFASVTNASGTSATISIVDAVNGPVTAGQDGVVPTGFTFLLDIAGVADSYETINLVNKLEIFSIKQNTIADIVAKINTNPMLEAVEHTSGTLIKATRDITGVAINEVAYYHNPNPSSNYHDFISFWDSKNWISSFQNANPNFQLKKPLVLVGVTPLYELDTAINLDGTTGEKFKLIPSTLDNLAHHMTHRALSQLNIVSRVSVANDSSSIQIKSQQLGSSGAIEIVGGSANNAKFKLIGSSQIVEDSDNFLQFKIPASPNTLQPGHHVQLENDYGVERISRLGQNDSIDVVKKNDSTCEYMYNSKNTNFNQYTKINIVDAHSLDPISYPTPGIVWRWTHDDSGSYLILSDTDEGSVDYNPQMRNAIGALTSNSEIHQEVTQAGDSDDNLVFRVTSSGVPDHADYLRFINSADSSWIAWFSVDGNLTPPVMLIGGTPSVQTVGCQPDVANSLNASYFILQTPNGDTVKFWYDNNNAGATEPAVGTTTRSVEINIDTDDDVNEVAVKTAAAIDSDLAFASAAVTPGGIITGSPTVHDIDCEPDIANSLDGSYFTLNAGNGDVVKFWYDNNDAGTTEPGLGIPGSPSIQLIECQPDVSNSLDTSYFVLEAGNGDTVKFWYDNNNAGAAEPAVGTTTRSLEINIDTNDDVNQVAAKTANAIDNDSAFASAIVTPGVIMPGSGVPSIQRIQLQPDISNSLNGSYFVLEAGNGDTVKFWYDNNNSGTAEPAVGTTTRSVEINSISTNDDSDAVATHTATAISSDIAFASVLITPEISNTGFVAQLNSSNQSLADAFGNSVAISGDYAVVGAPQDDGSTDTITTAGEAYIFKRNQGGANNWGLIKTLNSPNEDTDDAFGYSVAIDGDYIVVGAYGDEGSTGTIGTGEAYVYKKDQGGADNWGLIKTLNSDNEDDGDTFGNSVAIDGNYIVVGARTDHGTADAIGSAGEAYVYKKDQGGVDNWGLIKILNSDNEDTGDQFGWSVAISGDYIAVGAFVDDGSIDAIIDAGEVYVFKKDQGGVDNWGLIKILNSDNEDTADQFGYSVAISGDYIVVGAYGDDGSTDAISSAGEAYVFYKDQGGTDNWGLIKTLNSSNEDANDYFGWSVAISGNYIVVGAPFDRGIADGVSSAGEAYLFYKNQGGTDNWGFLKQLNSPNENGDRFGSQVAVDGDNIVVGASSDDGSTETLNDAGEAYIYSINLATPTPASIDLANADSGPVAIGTDGTPATNFTFSVVLTGTPDGLSPATITVTNSADGPVNAGVDGTTPTNFILSIDTIGVAGVPAVPSDRSVEINVDTDDDVLAVATKTADAIDNDSAFASATVTTTTVPGNIAIQTIGCQPDVSNSLNGSYFVLEAGNGDTVKFWYDNNNSGTVEPAVGTTTRSREINISTNDDFEEVATKTANIIDNDSAFASAIVTTTTAPVITPGSYIKAAATPSGYNCIYTKISGDYMFAVGSNGLLSSVFIHKKNQGGLNNWGLIKTLPFSGFNSIIIDADGDYLVVGAFEDGGSTNAISAAGEAYVYKKDQGGIDNWGLTATLNSPDEDLYDRFGTYVAISGNYIAVHAAGDDGFTDTVNDAGEVYIFKKDTGLESWSLIKSFTPGFEVAGNNSGAPLHLSGDYLVLKPSNLSSIINSTIIVYKKDQGGVDNWGLVKTITAPNFSTWPPNGNFGYSVNISGDYIIALETPYEYLHIFKKNYGGTENWGLIKTLTSPNPDAGDLFGWSAAISGNYIIVGAYSDDGSTDTTVDAGEAYVFYKDQGGVDNWGLLSTLNNPFENVGTSFGSGVSISSNFIATTGADGGNAKAYIFNTAGSGSGTTVNSATITVTNAQVGLITAGVDGAGADATGFNFSLISPGTGETISGATITVNNADNGLVAAGADGTPSTNFNFSVVTAGSDDGFALASITATSSQNGPITAGSNGSPSPGFIFGVTTNGVADATVPISADNIVRVDVLSTDTPNQIIAKLGIALSINGISSDFSIGQTPGATLSQVTEGSLLTLFSESGIAVDGWSTGNFCKNTGSNVIGGLPIVAVNQSAKYLDVENPDGKAMSATEIGGNEIIISAAPALEWHLAHSAPNKIQSIAIASNIATATTENPHGLDVGDIFTAIDIPSSASPNTGIVLSIVDSNKFTYASTNSNALSISPAGLILKPGQTRTRYKIESLGHNGMNRLSLVDGDSPKFLSCGAAVDDLLLVSGSSFGSANNGAFRILALDNDSIVYRNMQALEKLDTFVAFNNYSLEPTWTSNSNIVIGIPGTFSNLSIGDWVKKTTDEDTLLVQVSGFNSSLAKDATIVTLSSSYTGDSGNSPSHALDQNSDIGKGVYLNNASDIRILEGDSARVSDNLFISENTSDSWFSLSNSGNFDIQDLGTDGLSGRQYIRVNNSSGLSEIDVSAGLANSKFLITENDDNKFTSIREVYHTAIDPLNENRRIVYLSGGDRDYKWNENNSSFISSVGKIGYDNSIVVGIDGYKYYTGLLRKVQRIVDGFDPDSSSFPGRKAVGSAIEVLPPIPVKVSISVDITTQDGVNLSEITDEIASAIISYVSNLGVGEDVILSDIIVRIKNIVGVEAVTFVSPTPNNERISISEGEKAFIQPSDISIT